MKCKKRKLTGGESLNVINGPINVIKSYMKMMSYMKVLYVITFGRRRSLSFLPKRPSRLRLLRSRLVASLHLTLNVINS